MGRHSNRVPAAEEGRRPLYARVLGLRHIQPGWVLCFFFFEGIIALAIVLALVGFITWWGVLVLPVTVAAMVKLNDLVAGRLAREERARKKAARRAAEQTGDADITARFPTTTGGRSRRPATPPPATLPPRPSDLAGPSAPASSGQVGTNAVGSAATATGSAPARPTRPSVTGAAASAVSGSASGDTTVVRSIGESAGEPPADVPADVPADQLEGFISDIQDDGVPLSTTEPPVEGRGRSSRG